MQSQTKELTELSQQNKKSNKNKITGCSDERTYLYLPYKSH